MLHFGFNMIDEKISKYVHTHLMIFNQINK